jgi:hypothetical protein
MAILISTDGRLVSEHLPWELSWMQSGGEEHGLAQFLARQLDASERQISLPFHAYPRRRWKERGQRTFGTR